MPIPWSIRSRAHQCSTSLDVFAGFLLLGVPISLALGVAGLIYLYVTDNWMLVAALPQRMISGIDQFVLLTIPLFLLAGSLMNFGGLSTRMVELRQRLVGHFRAACRSSPCSPAFFSPAFPEARSRNRHRRSDDPHSAMARQGIPAAYAAALVAISAVIGPAHPAEHHDDRVRRAVGHIDRARCFIAGVIPGMLLGVALLVYAELARAAERTSRPRRA